MTASTRILVIDGEEKVRKVLSMSLQHAGYAVDTAGSGKEAIEKASTDFYNVTIFDSHLQDMEDSELLTGLGAVAPRTRKIVLTRYPVWQTTASSIIKEVDAYLVKPVDICKLLDVIKEHLDEQEDHGAYADQSASQTNDAAPEKQKTKQVSTSNSRIVKFYNNKNTFLRSGACSG